MQVFSKAKWHWVFPGSPVVRTRCLHCRGRGFHPLSGSWDTVCHLALPKKKKKSSITRTFWKAGNICTSSTYRSCSLFSLSHNEKRYRAFFQGFFQVSGLNPSLLCLAPSGKLIYIDGNAVISFIFFHYRKFYKVKSLIKSHMQCKE